MSAYIKRACKKKLIQFPQYQDTLGIEESQLDADRNFNQKNIHSRSKGMKSSLYLFLRKFTMVEIKNRPSG